MKTFVLIFGILYLLFLAWDYYSMDNLKFVFHVCKKTEFFKDVYVSPPYSNGDLCRDEANKKRAEYGKDYDVYYTIVKE